MGHTIGWLVGVLARDTTLSTDHVWVADSTPVERGRSRETARRSDLAGRAEYSYYASHPRFTWGPRLHLLCTLHELPVGVALTDAKADERQTLLDILDTDTDHQTSPGRIVIADKNYFGPEFEATLTRHQTGPAAPGPQGRHPTRRDEVLQTA